MSSRRGFAPTLFAPILFAATILLACIPTSLWAFDDTPAAREFRQQENAAQQTHLLPLLIGTRELEQWRLQLATAIARRQSQPISRPLVADLFLIYVMDSSDPAPLVNEDLVAAWGIDLDAVHARAVANLRTHFGDIRHKPVVKLPWLHVIDSDDGYSASRLLLLDKWAAIAIELGEPLIVGVPTRDLVVFTASHDPLQIQQLRETVETLAEHEGRPISRQLFVWHPEGWRPLD
jgi:hypothetical protein